MLADYYCALPKLSSTVAILVLRSELQGFSSHLEDLYECAFKLHLPELLRECAILMAGKWSYYEHYLRNISNSTLRRTLKSVRAGICEKIVAAQEACLELVEDDYRFASGYYVSHTESGTPHPCRLAEHYRKVSEIILDGDEEMALDYVGKLDELLGSNLKLKSTEGMDAAGRGESDDTFLCGEIDDEDLPWDCNQLDW